MIEQITYLLFIRRLDNLQTRAESKARVTGVVDSPVFLPGQAHLRWSRFKNDDPEVMYKLVSSEVFPFLQKLGEQVGGDGSTYSDHMRDARFTIPTPALLSKVVDMLEDIPMEQRNTNGDLYEWFHDYGRFNHRLTLVTASRLVRRTRPIWQYWDRPGFVRAASHPHQHLLAQAALNFNPAAATTRRWRSLTPIRTHSASWRTLTTWKGIKHRDRVGQLVADALA